MGIVISVANQKGSVGKTTSCVNLAAALAAQRKRVLLIDTDPQGNSTSGLGIDKKSLDLSTYDLLLGNQEAAGQAIIKARPYLDVLPSHIDLAGAEIELVDMKGREGRMAALLEPLKDDYAIVLSDCPLSLCL